MRGVEIQPVNAMQVFQTDRGHLVAIDDDVQSVARDLRDIDEGLKVWFDPDQDHFVIFHERTRGDGSVEEHLVTTAKELDQRVVERIRQISASDYDYVAEVERIDLAADRAAEHRFSEAVGPVAEELAFAFRKDLGSKARAFISRDLRR